MDSRATPNTTATRGGPSTDAVGSSPNARIAAVLRHIEQLPSSAGSVLVGDPSQTQGIIFVERNRVCWAAANGLGQRLCQLLRDHGGMQLSDAELKSLYAQCRATNAPIGEALVKRGLVTPTQLRASLYQHTAESLLAIDDAVGTADSSEWPITWFGRAGGSHHPRFTFATAEVLAAVGAAQTDRAGVEIMDDHLDGLRGVGCSAITFNIDDQGTPVLSALSMTATLFVDEVANLATWAHAALEASAGFSPAMVRTAVESTPSGGALAWRYEGSMCAAITPNASSMRQLVTFVDNHALPMVLSTKLPLLQRLRERGVGA